MATRKTTSTRSASPTDKPTAAPLHVVATRAEEIEMARQIAERHAHRERHGVQMKGAELEQLERLVSGLSESAATIQGLVRRAFDDGGGVEGSDCLVAIENLAMLDSIRTRTVAALLGNEHLYHDAEDVDRIAPAP